MTAQTDPPTNVGSTAGLGPLMDEARIAGAEVTDYVNYAYGEEVAVFDEGSLTALVLRVQSVERERWAAEAKAAIAMIEAHQHRAALRALVDSIART